MMEDNSENKLSKFISTINNSKVIDELSRIALNDRGGKLYLCFPRAKNQQEDLHLLFESENALELFEQASLTGKIQNILGYDHTMEAEAEIILHQRELFEQNKVDEVYENKVLLNKENFQDGSIAKFLESCYPEFIKSSQYLRSQQSKHTDVLEETVRYLSELPDAEIESVFQKVKELKMASHKTLISSK
jgi:hypothetical protein